MMKRILWLAMAAILLFGCATMYTQHEEIILPSGEPGHSVLCGSSMIQYCYKRMGEICQNGYTIIYGDESNNTTFIGGIYSQGSNKNFLFKCNK